MTTELDLRELEAAVMEAERILAERPVGNLSASSVGADAAAAAMNDAQDKPSPLDELVEALGNKVDFGEGALELSHRPGNLSSQGSSQYSTTFKFGGITNSQALDAIEAAIKLLLISSAFVGTQASVTASADLMSALNREHNAIHNAMLAGNANKYAQFSAALRAQAHTLNDLHAAARRSSTIMRDMAGIITAVGKLVTVL